jgi:glutamate N-acetyltransferase/amino-acid N-acetyltransferase
MTFIEGGITAPLGFAAHAVRAGIKASRKTEDTMLIFSDIPCAAAGIFTQNRVQAEPVKLSRRHLANGRAQAVIANAGNANACTGEQGMDAARRMATACALALDISEDDVLVASTGVIGQQLPVEKIEAVIPTLAQGLSKDGNAAARRAILTTDTNHKECAAQVTIGGKTVTLGAMAKGSGMIHINMGTMLGFITTDCAITAEMLRAALEESAAGTYNCVSVDGDTSTNDTLFILANGRAQNALIDCKGAGYDEFLRALNAINTLMAKKIAADGEGAERLLECHVSGAASVQDARVLAKSVIASNLTKAAFFGEDANWGRVLCAMGYSGANFTPEKTSLAFSSTAGTIELFRQGVPLNFDEAAAKKILAESEITIEAALADGNAEGWAWGCDLTYEYVKINGDYRT